MNTAFLPTLVVGIIAILGIIIYALFSLRTVPHSPALESKRHDGKLSCIGGINSEKPHKYKGKTLKNIEEMVKARLHKDGRNNSKHTQRFLNIANGKITDLEPYPGYLYGQMLMRYKNTQRLGNPSSQRNRRLWALNPTNPYGRNYIKNEQRQREYAPPESSNTITVNNVVNHLQKGDAEGNNFVQAYLEEQLDDLPQSSKKEGKSIVKSFWTSIHNVRKAKSHDHKRRNITNILKTFTKALPTLKPNDPYNSNENSGPPHF